MNEIRPIPDGRGTGFFSFEPVEANGYRAERVGRYHNYYATADTWDWPIQYPDPEPHTIDAFAPNLNKQLHVGHLRNLAVAKSFSMLFPNSRFVALLGAAIGELDEAKERLSEWFDFVDYHPDCYKDNELQLDEDFIAGEGQYEGCSLWEGPNGTVVVKRSDGSPTYDYHDLAFAKEVSPTHYITGAEQKEHFENLGLGDKHLPMGLVLDPVTGKKMKSRDGNALSAKEAIGLIIANFDPTPEPRKLAWNILAWNFLRVNRSQNLKFNVEEWTRPESPGLYITYTYARIAKALAKAGIGNPMGDLSDDDIRLLGYSSYLAYWQHRAIETMDTAPLAGFLHRLAQALGAAYHSEKIVEGRQGFQYALVVGLDRLRLGIKLLGMFPLTEV